MQYLFICRRRGENGGVSWLHHLFSFLLALHYLSPYHPKMTIHSAVPPSPKGGRRGGERKTAQVFSSSSSLPTCLLVVPALSTDDALAQAAPPPPAQDLAGPPGQREGPVAGDEHAAEDVDGLDEEGEQAVAALLDGQHDGLNVVLDEDPGDHVVADLVRLLRHGVLVREDGAARREGRRRRVHRVHRRHHRQEVLELVEVGAREVHGPVERVHERGVEGPEGELVDHVREVEGCAGCRLVSLSSFCLLANNRTEY